MKKAIYLAPETAITEIEVSKMICSSITKVDGDADIDLGEGDTPETADTRRHHSQWDDDELDEEEDY